MEILNSIFSWIIKKRIHQIELFKKYPHEVQLEWFSKLINAATETEWGHKYDFSSIRKIKDFQQRVPLQDYDSLKPYIERQQKGEKNILWPGEIKWFAKSSGTTSDKSKFIPVSIESLEECHYKGGKDMLSIYYNLKDESKLFSGKSLIVGGSSQINHFSPDSYYGDLSAIIIRNLPFWVEHKRTPDISIALMSEWEEKIEKMAETTSKEDVTNISGVPSWTLVLLKRILEITGKKSIKEVWPNLELYIHGGVNFTPYREQYHKIIPEGTINYMETYNASEGFFGIQDDLLKEELLLMLDYGIFYEFIPLSEINKENPPTLTLDEVSTGVNYALVISTNGGLWRYKIGDTVEFTSIYPYKIKVTGRTKHFINVFGEELIEENAENALKIACEKTESIIREYTAGPVYMSDKNAGSHEWLIEFEKKPNNIEYFTEVLDNALKSLNSDYEAKRHKNMALKQPVVKEIPQGTFYGWMKYRGKLGGQNKIPRLSNNRNYIQQIYNYIENNQVTG
jgi:hypothetical protein